MNEKTAMQMTAVDHPLYSLLHGEPNPEMTVNSDENGQLYYEYYMNIDDAHTYKYDGKSLIARPMDRIMNIRLSMEDGNMDEPNWKVTM